MRQSCHGKAERGAKLLLNRVEVAARGRVSSAAAEEEDGLLGLSWIMAAFMGEAARPAGEAFSPRLLKLFCKHRGAGGGGGGSTRSRPRCQAEIVSVRNSHVSPACRAALAGGRILLRTGFHRLSGAAKKNGLVTLLDWSSIVS